VRIVPQKGAIVSELSLDEINDVFDLRGIMEPRLLAQSAPHFTEQDFAGLDDIQEALREGDQGGQRQRGGASSMPTSIWRCTFTHGSRGPRRSSSRCMQTSDRYTRLQLSNTKAMGTAEKEHAHLIALCRAQQIDEACRFLEQQYRGGADGSVAGRRRWLDHGAGGAVSRGVERRGLSPSLRGSVATKQSIFPHAWRDGLLRFARNDGR